MQVKAARRKLRPHCVQNANPSSYPPGTPNEHTYKAWPDGQQERRLGRRHREHRAIGAGHLDSRSRRGIRPAHLPNPVIDSKPAAPFHDRFGEDESLAEETAGARVEMWIARAATLIADEAARDKRRHQ